MRDFESSEPLGPEALAELDAIDATLHGEPVDPDHAELAELSLILRDERPQPTPQFLRALDARAAQRFVARPARDRPRPRARGLWWGASTALAGAVAIALVVVLGVHGGGRSVSAVHPASAPASSSASGAASSASAPSSAAKSSAAAGSATPTASASATVPSRTPAPNPARGRDLTQSARLALRARPGRIDAVAQQLFDVVGAEHGYVNSSHVIARAGGAGSAHFALEVPAAHLQATLNRLSSLRGATVSSRSDASADITGNVNATAARLAGARALRRSLLRQLAAATTASQADRLQAQLRRNEATIVADAGALARLHAKVTDSAIAVTVTAPSSSGAGGHGGHSGGFTLHRALHDAGRILVVAAGVVLIALAVLVPLGLLVALGAWVWARTLRRRREGALDV